MCLQRGRLLIQKGSDLQVQRVGHAGQLDSPRLLAHSLWEDSLVQVVWVAPVGVVGHQEDLQEDHWEVVEDTLRMKSPEDEFLNIGTQFQ